MNLELQDRIDRYLRNQMSSEERISFKAEIDRDEELKETVELQRLIVKEIRRQSFMAILEKAENSELSVPHETDSKDLKDRREFRLVASLGGDMKDKLFIEKRRTNQLNFKWTIAIAAVVIGIAFVVWQPHKSSNQELFNSNALAYSTKVILDSDNTIKTRGGDIYFENLNSSENILISDALLYYNNEDYNSAKSIFEDVLIPKEKNNELTFYMSVSQLLSDDAYKAIENLEYLAAIPGFKFSEASNYYIALAYLETDQRSKARTLLKQIRDDNREYSQKASDILNKLRWF